MVTISPALQEKIERRARRAFSRFDEGSSPRLHRISSLGADRLNYRIPRSGRKQVEVVRTDSGVVVDPPTTDQRDLLVKSDFAKLKNSTDKIHAGEVTAYLLSDKAKKVGKVYKKADKLLSRDQCVAQVQSGQHVYVTDLSGVEITDVGYDHIMASQFIVTRELDPVKDLGFTDGLIDVLTSADVEKLKKHLGAVRAYMLVKAGTNYQFPTTYQVKSDPLKSRAQCVDQVKDGDHVYVVEADYDDLTLGMNEFTAREFMVTEELDAEKDLGFTKGLFDLRTKDDVISLRKKRHLGRVRAYKYVTKEAKSPTRTGADAITYAVGKDYEIKDADTDPGSNCHKGVNVADIEWAKGYTKSGDNRLFAFEFEMDDIAAIPTHTDGKFRVHRCKCVDELDPKTLKPIKPAPRSPQDDLEDLTAPEETVEKPKEKKKKKGFMDKLLGRGDEDDS